MQQVFVLDKLRKPLMPCSPARARQTLKKGTAAVFCKYPFTIILNNREGGEVQKVQLKIDPGSKKTGIALCGKEAKFSVLWAANLEHRGWQIKKNLDTRRALRRSRRNRHTRYRQPRFDNRTRPEGWLPPSLVSRVDNVFNWAKRLMHFCPVAEIDVETVRFDMQLIENPEIQGTEYQQGTLAGYEAREYLLEKFKRTCAYCGKQNVPLEIEHIVPRSKGGSDRISNLALACNACNTAKGNRSIEEFLGKDPAKIKRILAQTKAPLKDAAAVNATRYAIGNALKRLALPVNFWTGGRTKKNRISQGYAKDHWIDAACVGMSGISVVIRPNHRPLQIKATGRGARQMCSPDKYGFPRTGAKQAKKVKGFQTGDMVKAVVTSGKKIGTYIGRVAVRASGSFAILIPEKKVDGISFKYFKLIQKTQGYAFA
jgi:5-methylcytosine-specific restriction endonuclease McrA